MELFCILIVALIFLSKPMFFVMHLLEKNRTVHYKGWILLFINFFKGKRLFLNLVLSCFFINNVHWYKICPWASLVAQWLRICLPMRGTRI